jgi:hypothetical protein
MVKVFLDDLAVPLEERTPQIDSRSSTSHG